MTIEAEELSSKYMLFAERAFRQRDTLAKALEKIACRHVTEAPLWWQKEARDALDAVSTPINPKEN